MISLLEEKSAISKFLYQKVKFVPSRRNCIERNQSQANFDQLEFWRPNWRDSKPGKVKTS